MNDRTPKHITMQMWADAEFFDRVAVAGDTVDEDIVEQFRNSLPPICNREEYMQAGGAYSHILIKNKGVYAPTYTTFKKKDGVWVYCGNCLRHDTRDCTNLEEISE